MTILHMCRKNQDLMILSTLCMYSPDLSRPETTNHIKQRIQSRALGREHILVESSIMIVLKHKGLSLVL